mmetsp:Transcript_130421/g.363376  ORF Transcript_130421/g.363376 Transcript_130421/m.363376 type:complete len:278 (-) Transcript_130421:304-1137(-)
MSSRVARCCRNEAHVVVRSMGSSKALICALVSASVFLVWSILLLVSRISPSRRLLICWFSLIRSCSACSVLARASSAAFWHLAMSSLLSSRCNFAASSSDAADWLRRLASCCLFNSFLLLSCRETCAEAFLCAFGSLPRGVIGERASSNIVWWLRWVVRRHVSSMPRACALWSRSCLTSASFPSSSEIMAFVFLMASLSLRCVSMSVDFSDSKAISGLSRTCSRKGRRSRCSMRCKHSCIGGSLARTAASSWANEFCWCWMELSSESALFCSTSIRR